MDSELNESIKANAFTADKGLNLDTGNVRDGKTGATSLHPSCQNQQGSGDKAYTNECSSSKEHEAVSKNKALQFCTQGCLLGLSQGQNMDKGCPNYPAHCQGKEQKNHPISRDELRDHFIERTKEDIEKCCTLMDLGGADGPGNFHKRGKHWIFRIILTPFQYVLVGKGTGALTYMLRQEALVYDRLYEMQGMKIPVRLGSIPFSPAVQVYHTLICHMILLSHAGREIGRTEEQVNSTAIDQSRMQDLRRKGVFLSSIGRRNVLWSTELDRLVFIDFERAEVDPDEWDSDE